MKLTKNVVEIPYEIPANSLSNQCIEDNIMALDAIAKYQKIVQIYQSWNEVNDISYNKAMQMIGDVIEGRTND